MQTTEINLLFSRAEQAFLEGRLEEAHALLAEVRRVAPNDPNVNHLMALVESRRGAHAEARRSFLCALEGAPDDPEIHANLANFLAGIDNAQDALRHYDRALGIRPAFFDARLNRALLLQKLGRFSESLRDLDAAAALRPADPRLLTARGTALRAERRLTEAAAAYDAALSIEPCRPRALAGRARIAMERGEELAPELYRQAIALSPNDLELRLDLAEALEAQGDPAAVETLATAVATHPTWTKGQRVLARMRWESGEGMDFTSHLQRSLETMPGHIDLWVTYASALAEAGLSAEAADVAARARSSVGDDQTLVMFEAVHASEAGQLERADRLFAAASATFPGCSRLHARHRIRTGDYDEASFLLHCAREEMPWDIGAWALTGLLWRMTSHEKAEWLLGQPGLTDVHRLQLDSEELDSIAVALRSLHRTRTHPIGQSLRGGTQTRGRLFDRIEPEIVLLRRAVETAVLEHWKRLPAEDSAHPLLRHRMAVPSFEGSWSVRLTCGGFHIAHVHPQGLLSSACYFVVPASREPMEGWLELGGAPGGLDVPVEPLARIEPIPGRMALFPSYLFHGTRPFSNGERLTAAFDIKT